MILKDTLSQIKSDVCTKRESLYYLKYNCYRQLRREFGIARMILNARTEDADDARAHASYILCSTSRKST